MKLLPNLFAMFLVALLMFASFKYGYNNGEIKGHHEGKLDALAYVYKDITGKEIEKWVDPNIEPTTITNSN